MSDKNEVNTGKEEFQDNISFDRDGSIVNWIVNIIEITNSYVKFEAISGNVYTIPLSQVKEIKEKKKIKEVNDER